MIRQFESKWTPVLPLAGRAVALGAALFFILTRDPGVNLRLNFAAFLVAAVWSHYNGIFGRRQVGMSGVEGLFVYLGAVAAANILSLLFGNPLLITSQ